MEQEEIRGEENKPQPQPPQPQPHQKCPRCQSQNTKFCYYNNYSLSQPRYYCKGCKRYWTHGGTLRNIPVGGGSRKGKRAKSSSASASNSIENSSSMSSHQQPPQRQAVVQTQPKSMAKGPSSSAVGSQPLVGPYYHGGGGYLSSLAAIRSLNPSQPFNQSLTLGSSSNSGLLSGFNVANSLGSQNQQRRQFRPSLQFYQTGNRHREVESLYAPNSSMANSHPDWLQGFNDSANRRGSDASLWNTINTTSISGGNSDSNNVNTAGSSYLIPNHWPDMPGYGPPS